MHGIYAREMSGYPYRFSQDAEKGRQRRSHLESILNVAQRLRLRFSLACGLAAERRVLARRGWVGEKSDLFDHPLIERL